MQPNDAKLSITRTDPPMCTVGDRTIVMARADGECRQGPAVQAPGWLGRHLPVCGHPGVLLAGCRPVIWITGCPPGPSAHWPHGPPSALTPSRSSVPSMARAGW